MIWYSTLHRDVTMSQVFLCTFPSPKSKEDAEQDNERPQEISLTQRYRSINCQNKISSITNLSRAPGRYWSSNHYHIILISIYTLRNKKKSQIQCLRDCMSCSFLGWMDAESAGNIDHKILDSPKQEKQTTQNPASSSFWFPPYLGRPYVVSSDNSKFIDTNTDANIQHVKRW